ncbi:MAG TPA: type IX secretion system membrane protein PorP/SprF [Flavobacterium sp.]|jgi:type IX secretion system PorP/SprF family membrane protein|uniref:Type IX secretion system membrane protein PorP/SprF n=1 Tax=Flavobacterium celericrescens TaxID=2709780 RepID=A0ABX0IEF8_9FLAO|nr:MULTISPECIES: type IX secretion system membrane protein PorP/SprF [Flavobacterium]NHM04901.1 type IX secretion system membrane protein PorP/SprF [Flavobacterium celericrescens]HLO73955.1 type IX secretion system membrane protein PorP/SprF [Flavobacterium sp.]
MKKLYLVALVVIATVVDLHAQQDPHYTQYMYNMNVINPAYAGSKENLSIGMLYRKQWVEIEDAPTTATLSGHAPVGKNVGLGLSVISDKIGPVEENNIYADFSYTLNLGGEHKLAFGLKTGITLHNVALYSDIYNTLPQPNDPAFSEDTNNSYLNMGAGFFYYTNKYYLALSVPNMIKSKHLDFNGREFGSETSHYFLTGGYVFDVSENIKFKPFFMLKSAFNAPSSLDLSTNFLFNQKFEAGVTYRLDDSFGAMVNYAITPNVKLGYAYDHIVSDLNVTTPSSHEIILLFDLNFPKKVSSSPRFF